MLETNSFVPNEKELKILKLTSADKTTHEIAKEMDISHRTVESIRDKMKIKAGGLKHIAALVAYAYE
ncbi:MAG TPA: LuxR C-terminal-related transcriptional regulator, partial [Candidatus Paceibacterota bacterium]|nr:LuxR C-terminal-related transcriptional regulator [Candidatus Paceibacterota bacterium]